MRVFFVAMLVLAAPASAQDQPIVRMTIAPEQVNVGEAAELQVTVLVPTWFANPPVFPSFEVANAVTRLPPNSSYPTSQRVGGDTWSGVVRNYRVYPLSASTYRLGGGFIRVIAADPGSDPSITDVAVPEVTLTAIVPAGAEDLDPYVAGSSLMLTRVIDGELDTLEAGDAIVVRTVAELDGLPAMFLPPLSPELGFEGLSVYVDEPVVEDADSARRSEKVTLIFESGGEFTLPAIKLDWWDTTSNGVATATVPEVSISVTGPTIEAAGDEATGQIAWWDLMMRLLGALIAALLGWRILRRLRIRAKDAAARHRESESYTFAEFAKACKNNEPTLAHHAMLAWLKRINWHGNSASFACAYGDKSLRLLIDALSSRVYHVDREEVNLTALLGAMKRARSEYLGDQRSTSRAVLPPLNP